MLSASVWQLIVCQELGCVCLQRQWGISDIDQEVVGSNPCAARGPLSGVYFYSAMCFWGSIVPVLALVFQDINVFIHKLFVQALTQENWYS